VISVVFPCSWRITTDKFIVVAGIDHLVFTILNIRSEHLYRTYLLHLVPRVNEGIFFFLEFMWTLPKQPSGLLVLVFIALKYDSYRLFVTEFIFLVEL
jgi:hypothetical protein